MRGKNILWISWIAILLSVGMIDLGFGQPMTNTTIMVEPTLTTGLLPGDNFWIDVNIINARDVYTWQFWVRFQPAGSVLGVLKVEDGDFGVHVSGYNIFPVEGFVIVIGTLWGRVPGVYGNGTLARIQFTVIDAGESPLELDHTLLISSTGEELPHQTRDGYYKGPTATLISTGIGKRSESPISVRDEYVGVEEWISVTGESVGVGGRGETTFYLANAPLHEGTETIYVDGVAQTRDVHYTINYETGQITFAKAPKKDKLITADYKYDGQVVFNLAHTPLFNATKYLTVYVDGVAQTQDVDYTVDEANGLIMFTYIPDDGAVITADYKYSPIKLFKAKVKNEGDVPLYVKVRFDMIREDMELIRLGAGQEFTGFGPAPVVYLYANEYNPWLEWDWNNPGTSVLGPPDGSYTYTNVYSAITSLYGFEDITLAPGDVIGNVKLEAYTQYPAGPDADNDLDAYTSSFDWLGSLYGDFNWGWVRPRWIGTDASDEVPSLLTEEGLNSFEVLIHYWTADGTNHGEARIDALRLRVELSSLKPLDIPVYVVEPGQVLELDPAIWTLTPYDVGKYHVTATLYFSYSGITWNRSPKTSTFTWWLKE